MITHMTIAEFFDVQAYQGRAVLRGTKADPVLWVTKLTPTYYTMCVDSHMGTESVEFYPGDTDLARIQTPKTRRRGMRVKKRII